MSNFSGLKETNMFYSWDKESLLNFKNGWMSLNSYPEHQERVSKQKQTLIERFKEARRINR